MSRAHLAFKNIHRSVQKAADDLFKSKPWRDEGEQQHAKFSAFLRKASAAYDITTPILEFVEADVPANQPAPFQYEANEGVIRLTRYSVLSLFACFHYHMQAEGLVDGASRYDPDDDAAFRWACSLFYSVRPRLFRKAVRAGRVLGVSPEDLLRSDSTYGQTTSEEGVRDAVQGGPEFPSEEPQRATTEGSALDRYEASLREQELSRASVRKHVRIARALLEWMAVSVADSRDGDEVIVAQWLSGQDLTESSAATYRGSALRYLRWVSENESAQVR
jgi:hypothetical protein